MIEIAALIITCTPLVVLIVSIIISFRNDAQAKRIAK